MDETCTIARMTIDANSPIALTSWASDRALRLAANRVQKRLAEAHQGVPRWKLAQQKLVPTQREIAQGLYLGQYRDLL